MTPGGRGHHRRPRHAPGPRRRCARRRAGPEPAT
nr:MAG TPA: hypothetical protein [Siphoviridae sp. ctvS314]